MFWREYAIVNHFVAVLIVSVVGSVVVGIIQALRARFCIWSHYVFHKLRRFVPRELQVGIVSVVHFVESLGEDWLVF